MLKRMDDSCIVVQTLQSLHERCRLVSEVIPKTSVERNKPIEPSVHFQAQTLTEQNSTSLC